MDDLPRTDAHPLTRRRAIQLGAAGAVVLGAGAVAAPRVLGSDSAPALALDRVAPTSPEVLAAEQARRKTGRVVRRRLTARPTTIDLGGHLADTWAFDDAVPAREIRGTVGDQLRVTLRNGLPEPTTVHWHGLALRNDMDGVPTVTMDAVAPGASYDYSFTLPHPGTYWFHPHWGVQLDTGLMGPLVIEDPREPLVYDHDVVLLLDDWTDGVGTSPSQNLADLGANGMSMTGMASGADMSDMVTVDAEHPIGTDTGDVSYPLHLVNGRPPDDPYRVEAKPGDRLRLRLVNAGSDTAYRFAIGGHRLTVVATDGFGVQPVEVDTLVVGMGERYDVLVTAEDGAFPVLASPEGKTDPAGVAILRTSRSAPTPTPRAVELTGRMLSYADLRPTPSARMSDATPSEELPVVLQMVDGGRQWRINDRTWADHTPLDVTAGRRVRLTFDNQTSMFHPMHLHGHTFAVLDDQGRPGVRKDTVNVLPMRQLSVDVETDNPGQWLVHCHNLYHGELGMMTTMSYVR